jgi:hypothetical protein
MLFTEAMETAQSATKCIPEALLPRVKRQGREAEYSPSTTARVKDSVDLYIHSPIRVHFVVFNQLSAGTNLLFIAYIEVTVNVIREAVDGVSLVSHRGLPGSVTR